MVASLMRDERLPGRKFSDASAHEIAGILIGQIERLITLLNRQHAEFPPFALSQALTSAAGAVKIYTASEGRTFFRLSSLSVSAAATITIATKHITTGPTLLNAFIITVAAAGPVAMTPQEFVLPENGEVWITTSADATVELNASLYDGSEPALIMNYEV